LIYDSGDRFIGEFKFNAVELEHALVLLDESVAGLQQNAGQRRVVEFIDYAYHWETANEFGDKTIFLEIFWQDFGEEFQIASLID
jgi:hypothetical protein